jgi:branched-chain amino acid transport system ATP-binding protein
MLELSGVETFYGRKQVLFGVDMVAPDAGITALVGRNGMGKTTTVRSIMGFTPRTSGSIRFDGRDIGGLKPHQIARAGIGLVPEGRRLFANLTVEENLLVAAREAGSGSWNLERVFTLFPRVQERRHQMSMRLSGGEQQMVAIGRALMTNPSLVILDEATEGLAPLVRREIWSAIGRLREMKCSVVVIDKNLPEFAHLVDVLFVMEKGRVVWSGDARALLGDPAATREYLGI